MSKFENFSNKIRPKSKGETQETQENLGIKNDIETEKENVESRKLWNEIYNEIENCKTDDEKVEFAEKYLDKLRETDEDFKLLPTLIAYRDNKLYRDIIPVMLEKLKKDGREVKVYSFPEGTEIEEITKVMEQESEPFPNSNSRFNFFGDRTFDKALEGQDQFTLRRKTRTRENLDNFIAKALTSNLFETDSNDIGSISERINDIKVLFNKIAEKIGLPKELYIVTRSLNDHVFFLDKKNPKEIAEKIKEEFSNSINASQIHIVESISEVPGGDDVAILYDRHATNKTENGQLKHEKIENEFSMRLPIADGVYEAVNKKIVDILINDVDDQIYKQMNQINFIDIKMEAQKKHNETQ